MATLVTVRLVVQALVSVTVIWLESPTSTVPKARLVGVSSTAVPSPFNVMPRLGVLELLMMMPEAEKPAGELGANEILIVQDAPAASVSGGEIGQVGAVSGKLITSAPVIEML